MITDHIPDEWLDQYCRGELLGEPRKEFLDHMLACAECRQRLGERLAKDPNTE